MSTTPVSLLPAAPALAAAGVAASRGGRRLLADVNLEVQPGQFWAVLGANGAGKSTLLAALAGDLPPAAGTVQLAGRPIGAWSAPERARLRAVLPQEVPVAFGFTGLEIALLGRSAYGGTAQENNAIALAALAEMDAAQFARRRYPTLSGGEKMRVQLARVRAQLWSSWENRPRVLLLDEPTSALDLKHQHLVLARARGLARNEGMAVVAVLHDVNLAVDYADHLLLLADGKVLAQGPTAAVRRADLLSATYGLPLRVQPWGVQVVRNL